MKSGEKKTMKESVKTYLNDVLKIALGTCIGGVGAIAISILGMMLLSALFGALID